MKAVIEEWRAELGINQDELARAADLSLSTLQRILRGHKPLLKHARALESVLGWERGSLDTVVAGGQPTPLNDNGPTETFEEQLAATRAEIEAGLRQAHEALARIDALLNERRNAG